MPFYLKQRGVEGAWEGGRTINGFTLLLEPELDGEFHCELPWWDERPEVRPEGQQVRTCRVCGCTDERACPEGCWWVEEDLCSECAES